MSNIILDGPTGGYTGGGIPDITRSNRIRQPETNNFLHTNYYRLVLGRLPTMTYMCQSINIPSFSIGTAIQSTALGLNQKRAGDTYNFEDFTISFLVDENMTNYTEMFNWMVSIAAYESNIPIELGGEVLSDFYDYYSDARILVTNSAYVPKKEIILKDCLPTNLTGIQLSSAETDATPVIASATFAFTSMRIYDYPSEQRSTWPNTYTPPDP